jgi:uncharacterized protein
LTSVSLRLYAELAELAGSASHLVPVDGARSVKDVVESVGVPHVEVALLLCDGTPVGFEHRVTGGERVSALPPLRHLGHEGAPVASPPPPTTPRFVCDVHLGTLSRRLRLLGLDTLYDRSWDDLQLADVAAREDRILLSRDRGLLKRRSVTHGYLPRSDDPDEQTVEVAARFRLGEHLAPSTRCVRCNGVLAPVDRAEVADEVPPRTLATIATYTRCGSCDQVYWPGSHQDAVAPLISRVRAAGGVPSTRTPGADGQ